MNQHQTGDSAQVNLTNLGVNARGDAPSHGLLTGRRLLVIGGGQETYGQEDPPTGIGRAISVLAAREGASVAVADLSADSAADTVQAITDEGHTAHQLVGDASNEHDVVQTVASAVDVLGGLDAVAINVGIAGGHFLADTTSEEWDRVLGVNVRSAFLGCKHTIPLLPPGGSIVFTSSTASRVVSTTDLPAYTTSKAALVGLCAYAAKEAALRQVRANIVEAGLIDTSLGRLASLVKADRDTTPIPLGRQGTAWDVAAAIIFLLSDSSSYITGQTLAVDGGLSNVR